MDKHPMQQHASSYFVGYARLEMLLDSHAGSRVIYCAPAHVLHADLIQEHWVVVADIQEAVCRYWRMRLAAVPLTGALRPDSQALAARVASALQALDGVIKGRRFRVEAGLVAIPDGLALLSGETDLIAYDKLADVYRPVAPAARDPSRPASEAEPCKHGHLAMQDFYRDLPLQVLQSSAGFYIGTSDEEGPVTRESIEYFMTRELAVMALQTGAWTQRREP